jgi:putative phosphoesterase
VLGRCCCMKIGLVSDVHGNVAALETALDLMNGADKFFCLGDAIDQFRFSNEVVRVLRDRCTHVIQGNHEETFFGAGGERARSHAWIDKDLMAWLEQRPSEQQIVLQGRNIHLVHSTPWLPRGDYVSPQSLEFSRFGETDAHILIYGHTHVPVVARVNGTLVVNPGSTGQGSFVDGERRMGCAVLDLNSEEVDLISFTM